MIESITMKQLVLATRKTEMHGYPDEWWKKRLCTKFDRYRLPGPNTIRFDLPIDSPPESLHYQLSANKIDRPLLAFVDNPEHWTLLAMRGVYAYQQESIVQIELESIQRLQAANTSQLSKQEFHQLEIVDKDNGRHLVWAPQGPEFFAFWSILKWMVEVPVHR
jgi:hypothetical protein